MSLGMPPLDLGSLIYGGAAAELEAACGCEAAAPSEPESGSDDPYAPAESLRLRIGEDVDWADVVAVAVLERDDSTKGAGANPKCAAAARTSLSAPAPRAVAVVIGGLPVAATAGKAARDHHARRRSPCQLQLGCRARVFAAGEAAAADAEHQPEPGSPKVSCLGGVRSQQRTAADEGTASGRHRWWAWLLADVVFCCWNGRRDTRPRPSKGE